MKLLIDSCISQYLGEALRAAGHDVDAVGNWPRDPGDPQVLDAAAAAGRVLITADRGFGELVVHKHRASAGIIVLRNIPPSEHFATCERILAEHAGDLLSGRVVIATPERIRARGRAPDA